MVNQEASVKERILPVFISGGAIVVMIAVIILTLFVAPVTSIPSERLIPTDTHLGSSYRLLPLSWPSSLHHHHGES